MTTEAKGLDVERAVVARRDREAVDFGWTETEDDTDHIRHALTVADTLAARLAETEAALERTRAVGPRWDKIVGGPPGDCWDLYVGDARLDGSRVSEMSDGMALDAGAGVYYDNAHEAARAVCERLGLPVILDGLPEGGEPC